MKSVLLFGTREKLEQNVARRVSSAILELARSSRSVVKHLWQSLEIRGGTTPEERKRASSRNLE